MTMKKYLLLVGMVIILSFAVVPPTQGANLFAGDVASLINAINIANTNGEDDVITLTADIALTATNNVTDGNNGLPSILSDGGNTLTIEGAGFVISGNATDFRILHVAAGANLTLNNIGINEGRIEEGNGGGIFSLGALTITNSTITNHRVHVTMSLDFLGGAIFATGDSLTVSNTVFANNSIATTAGLQRSYGGAIGVTSLTVMDIRTSTFSGNSVNTDLAGQGGAIGILTGVQTSNIIGNTFLGNNAISPNSAFGGAVSVNVLSVHTVTITNNTFSNNSAIGNTARGGALHLGGGLQHNIFHNTFVENSAVGVASTLGSGIYSDTSANRLLFNNLFAGGTGGNDCFNLLSGNNNASDGSCATTTVLNPVLGVDVSGTLLDNGGQTRTYALPIGSRAIDAANALNCPATDQRGFVRPVDGDNNGTILCDIGAYEFAEITARFDTISSTTPEAGGTHTVDIIVTIPNTLTSDLTVTVTDSSTGSATAGADYTAFTSQAFTLPIGTPAGVYTQTLTLTIANDMVVENPETIDLSLTVSAGAVLGSPTTHTVIISDDETTTIIITEQGETIIVPVGGGGDPEFIFKTVDNPFATVGQTVTYTIRARNPKATPLTQVVIYDVFDERLADIRLISTTHGVGRFVGNTLTVDGFTLQPNEESVIVVSARVASLGVGDTIPNAAILESPDASVHVSNLVLVGDNPSANGGSSAQVFLIPNQLPATGEHPLWRDWLWVIGGIGMVVIAIWGVARVK